MPSFTQWQNTQAYPAGDAPFDVTRTGGPQPFFHNLMDERRSMWRATPEAQYPDGYLGTLNTRRQDRLLNNIVSRAQTRPYSRGVHKGERIDGRDYYWPEEFNPDTGLMLQAVGEKFTPPGLGMEWTAQPLWENPTIGLRGVPRGGTATWNPVDPNTRAGMVRQAPPWSTGRASMVTPYPSVGRG